jgi:UDP-N-acetyl-2-amino-2-deoxyglucuronate dehydrogenase
MSKINLPGPDKKIRFAVVGCGRIASNHFESLKWHADRAELVAVCDSDPRALQVAVEKTGARSFRSLDELLDARMIDAVVLCTPSGLKQNRRNATPRIAKSAIESGWFGRICMVVINVLWARPQSYYDSAKWRGTWEFDGGALMNQASHNVNLLDWLLWRHSPATFRSTRQPSGSDGALARWDRSTSRCLRIRRTSKAHSRFSGRKVL